MERFLPGSHQIESFGNGGFRLGGVSHLGSILITPSGVRACPAIDVASLHIDYFAALLAERNSIDMLLVGTGREMEPLPKLLVLSLKDQGIGYDTMSTNAAVRTYNVVQAEGRRVAAMLIAVDRAYG